MRIYTKDELIEVLKSIRNMGWLKNARPGNVGGIGNTLEDLLEITENNLPIPNSGEWELKCQRKGTTSLTTLFHMEPSPRAIKFVPNILLPKYGWPHQQAGAVHSINEMSFRQTINALSSTDRGFILSIDRNQRKIMISFMASRVDPRHNIWSASVKQRVGTNELNPQPYWGFDDVFHKVGTKLHNCFYIQADVKHESGIEYFMYTDILMLQKLSLDKFISAIEHGWILIDFDARSGHNHGTKFRLRQDKLPALYGEVTEIK